MSRLIRALEEAFEAAQGERKGKRQRVDRREALRERVESVAAKEARDSVLGRHSKLHL